MTRFEAVIFDMDGLLLDSERISLSAFNETLDAFGLGERTELFLQIVGTNAESCRRILDEGIGNKVDSDRFANVWLETYLKRITKTPVPLKNGVKELLTHIKNMGLPTAVATSTESNLAKKKLAHSGIRDYFDLIVGGEQVQKSKPNPEIYLEVARKLSVNPKNCLGLEDSENGVKAAVAAGLTVIQIPDMVYPGEELKKLGHIILDDLDDVIDYLSYN